MFENVRNEMSNRWPKIIIEREMCKGCQLCIFFCPKGVLDSSKDLNKKGFHFVRYKGSGCIGCMNCAIICPDTCIEVYR